MKNFVWIFTIFVVAIAICFFSQGFVFDSLTPQNYQLGIIFLAIPGFLLAAAFISILVAYVWLAFIKKTVHNPAPRNKLSKLFALIFILFLSSIASYGAWKEIKQLFDQPTEISGSCHLSRVERVITGRRPGLTIGNSSSYFISIDNIKYKSSFPRWFSLSPKLRACEFETDGCPCIYPQIKAIVLPRNKIILNYTPVQYYSR